VIHRANAESTGATVPGANGGLRPWTAPRHSDRYGRPLLLAPLPERSAAEPLIAIFHQLPKRDSKACLASDSQSGRSATARQGGDSQNGLFPGPSGSGVFTDPNAGAAAKVATPAVPVAFPGIRIRMEQRGWSIQFSRLSQPRARAARACSSLRSATGAPV
jgi:hypothetical protein